MLNKTNNSLEIIRGTEEKEAKVLAFAMQKSMKDISDPRKRPGLDQMTNIIKQSQRLLSAGPMRVDQQQFQKALVDKTENIITDPRLYKIDDYASDKGIFGLDIPEKLFWEGYVVRNDISQEEGSEHGKFLCSIPALR